jgi:hypothetical protein
VEMVGHEAVGIIGAVAATGVAIVIVAHAHTVEGIVSYPCIIAVPY